MRSVVLNLSLVNFPTHFSDSGRFEGAVVYSFYKIHFLQVYDWFLKDLNIKALKDEFAYKIKTENFLKLVPTDRAFSLLFKIKISYNY